MIDIAYIEQGKDLAYYDTETFRAANILSVQLGSLAYAPDLGPDLDYFLNNTVEFQNTSFKAYLVQVLANNSINVASVVEVIQNLYNEYVFNLAPKEDTTGLIAR